ncbi:MAG: glutathione S-transferase family protein [Alphaproteobacteria bacterium]|nr:glutathione S-transferase family protein [Alphaproteobacteria bacterium]
MYTLYYSPGACSMAIHVVLNELGAPFELKKVSIGNAKQPDAELLKVNPRGSVPVLADDGLVIREGAAILLWLLEKHPNALMPREGKARAQALEWLMFANATMHPAYGRMFFLNKNIPDKAQGAPLLQAGIDHINKLWRDVEEKLKTSRYVAGDACTVGDIVLAVIANWSGNLPGTVELGPNVKRLLKDVTSRPAYQKALATEQVEYKAAA